MRSYLANWVRDRREDLGWGKEEAARQAGISSITWKRVEDGLSVRDYKRRAIVKAIEDEYHERDLEEPLGRLAHTPEDEAKTLRIALRTVQKFLEEGGEARTARLFLNGLAGEYDPESRKALDQLEDRRLAREIELRRWIEKDSPDRLTPGVDLDLAASEESEIPLAGDRVEHNEDA